MRTLYLECYSGISGDMTVAALLDLGADQEKLLAALKSLPLDGYRVEITRTFKNGVAARDFHVILEDAHSHHVHRGLKEIFPIIDGSKMDPSAKLLAKDMFQRLAQAEGKVHGKAPEEVHFHEVGAVDSIVDLCAAAVCFADLNVKKVCCSPLYEGRGTVACQHGRIPVPAPAVCELAREHQIPLHITETQGEMVTPTGAAIVATLADTFAAPPLVNVKAIGVGAGKKDFPQANILRAYLLEEPDEETADRVWCLETNVDDMTGEALGFAMERLFEEGAVDVWFTPIQMKKNRPGVQLTVLCKDPSVEAMTRLIFRETSAIGLRKRQCERAVMNRTKRTVETPYGPVSMKECTYGNIKKASVEYEDARRASLSAGVPLRDVCAAAKTAYENMQETKKELAK